MWIICCLYLKIHKCLNYEYITIPMLCSKYSDCEAPISIITEILSKNDPIKFVNLSNEFKALGFTKVNDLAQTTFGRASSIKLTDYSLRLLYKVLEIYDKHLDDLQTSAKLENQNGNFIRTQQICEELLQQKPNDLNVITLMGESFFKCGNYEKSLSFLRKAQNLKPNSFHTLINMACNYWKQSRYDLAKLFILEAIPKSPCFNDSSWIYYAELLVKTNDIAKAEFVYNQILNAYPDLYTVRNNYGKFLLSQKKIINAKQQFEIVQKSAPEFQETLSNLGDVYFLTDKFDEAILNYHKALDINPNLKITLFNLGKVYFQITEYQKAVEAFEKSIELDPKNASALRYLAVAYCNQDKISMSIKTYKKYLKLLPDDFDINLELALIYVHNVENFQEAENCFIKCIKLNPKRQDLYKNLIEVYQQLNKRIDASNICMKLGDLCLEKSDLENARNAFITALFLNPENADGHYKLSVTMNKLNHNDLALIRITNAKELKYRLVHP
ncbi:hypothetical protein AGLY_006733 [Aphis glycines]|uniref:UDP-N-acetylglucosamine--peptide N-acetylglucosaminyltransferase SPINDLY n=1 Tax=Aphis glycines TaxID=307491 RepID=A0A6G0TQ34_APHGL|nr:hypothetical protein AGLY_006733 [Aphis glycines]